MANTLPIPRRRRHRLSLDTRLLIEWSILTLALCLLAAALTLWSRPLGVTPANQLAYDLSMKAFGFTPADPDIVIIAIDDNSLKDLGYWPWRRSVHADLLTHLKEASAVGLDILFSEERPQDARDDALLASAIAANGRIVLVEALDSQGLHTLQPLPALARAAAAVGRIDAVPDAEGTLRKIQLWRTAADGTPLPHASLQLQHLAKGIPLVPGSPSAINAFSYINFTGPPLHYTMYSYVAVLRGEVPDSAFKDRIVLVGAWATGLSDQHATPMGQRSMAGVEILANTLQNLRSNLWIHYAEPLPATLLALIPILLICLILRKSSARTSTVSVVAALPLCLLMDALAMHWLHYWVPPSGALVAIALAYPLWGWRSQEASLQYLDAELERLHIPAPAITSASTLGANTLSARAVRLHRAVSYIEQSARQREETLSFISHDMRAPQSTILAAIELRQQLPEKWPEAVILKDIGQQAHATLDLATNFLQLARAESADLDRETCSLKDLLLESCSQVQPLAERQGIQISCEPTEEDGTARVDRSLVGRAITNLMDNAASYCPPGSRVQCTLGASGSFWEIRIHDNGPGIAPEQIPQLFTRYRRGPAPGNPHGSGLGLAFVATVAQRHGGDVQCESTLGVGTQFILRLPRDQAAAST